MKKLFVLFILQFSLFTSNSQNLLTKREIFDFEIGDEFHTSYRVEGHPFDRNSYTEKEVIDKWYSSNLDTLYYRFDVIRSSAPANPGDNWTLDSFEYTLKLDSLDSIPANVDSTVFDTTQYNGRLVCYANKLAFNPEYKYIKGCGGPYYYAFNPPTITYNYDLRYFKKGSEEWGERFYLGQNETENGIKTNIYPNPTAGPINIEIENPSSSIIVTVYDIAGKHLEEIIFEPSQRIQVNKDYPRGLYYINIKQESTNSTFKVIIE